MFREALHLLLIREEPAADAATAGEMLPGEIGRQVELSTDEQWAKVVILSNFLTVREGWIRLIADIGELTQIVEAPPRPDFSLWAFLKAAVDTETWINGLDADARFFVIADYLIALASIETNIKNAGQKDPLTDGIGPYQLSTQNWQRFTDAPAGEGYGAADREEALTQISGAAFLAIASMNAISDGIAAHDSSNGDDETSGETGPFIPSYIDVLLAHLFGDAAAIEIRKAKMGGNGGSPAKSVLINFFNEDEFAKLAKYRSKFLQDAETGEPETIDGLLINADKVLRAALVKAHKLMAEHIPEDLPKTDGTAPWFGVAQSEHDDWANNLVNEDTPGGTQRVLEYFQAIQFPTTTVQPWCGAFAGHCMLNAGPPFNATVVNGPARAANWKSWGNTAIPLGTDDVPMGAIVVLAPEKGSSRSGHVGFFSRYFGGDKSKVEILGGNQSDTVTNTKFARSKIAAIRWYSPKEQKEHNDSSGSVGNSPPGQFSALLDFIGQHESNNNYNAFFGNSGNASDPDFTAMTVAAVIAWQRAFLNAGSKSSAVGKYQFLRNTLLDLVKQGHATPDQLFVAAIQDKLAIALMERRKLGRYITGAISTVEFGIHLAKEWASLPVTRDVKRGNRIVRQGQSYYAGDGLNKALVSVPAFLSAIDTARS